LIIELKFDILFIEISWKDRCNLQGGSKMRNSDLKRTAKEKLSGNFLTVILAMIIVGIVSGFPSTITQSVARGGSTELSYVFSLVGILLIPIQIGYLRIHMDLSESKTLDLERIFSGFIDGKYKKNVITMFVMGVFVFLWTLLLIIPGIVKAFAYAMTPYILADPDFDDLSPTEAITKSREMMDGNKLRYFFLGLSFILWIFVIIITLGIATLYVGPYMQQTMAEFYFDVKGVPQSRTSASSGMDPLSRKDDEYYD